MLSLAAACERMLPRRDVDEAQALTLGHGAPLPAAGIDGPYAVFDPAGAVIAIVSERDGKARAEVVLAPAGGN
jgi:tRNA pseudouridine55 synthase